MNDDYLNCMSVRYPNVKDERHGVGRGNIPPGSLEQHRHTLGWIEVETD